MLQIIRVVPSMPRRSGDPVVWVLTFSTTGKEAKLTFVNVMIVIKNKIIFFIKQIKAIKKSVMLSIIKKEKVGVAGLQPTLISLDYDKL